MKMKLAPVALAVQAALLTPAFADEAPVNMVMDTLTVTFAPSADASKEGLVPAYAGGQVAKGTRLGFMGNSRAIDTPFSTTGYTGEFIEQTQANSVGDVLKHDPSVRISRGFGNFQESYNVRGFVTNSDDTLMNGLYGILPRQYIASELFERVEVQRGAGTFLNGMAPSGTNKGGTIALQPKRADSNNTKSITASYESDSAIKVTGDIAQRFGTNQEFGARVIATHEAGDTAIDNEEKKLSLLATGLDYRGEDIRVSADLGYQNHELTAARTNVNLSGLSRVPNPAKSTSNWAQPWSFSNEKDVFGTLRGEYDIRDNITAYAAYGFRKGEEENSLANLTVSNTDGTGSTYRFDNLRKDRVNTGELGVRGRFNYNNTSHNWAISANMFDLNTKNAYQFDWRNTLATNLYNPTRYSQPAWSATASGGNWATPQTTTKTRLTSLALGDTIGLFNENLKLTLGARWQKADNKSYAYNTGALTSDYSKSRVTPALAVNYRVGDNVSVFANYVENLTAGEIVSAVNATNYGQALKPYVTKQYEIGTKFENGDLGLGLTAFSTKSPRYALNNNTYGEQGKNEHRGLELTVYGEPKTGLRVLGGATLLNTKQKNTGTALTDGKQVLGAAKFQANARVEYDLPQIAGLTLVGDVIHTGKRYADTAETLAVNSYTTLDLGARYNTRLYGHNVVFNGILANVTDKNYWAGVGGYESVASGANNGTYLYAGEPRTLKLSATVNF